MPINWTKPVETNRPSDETPKECWDALCLVNHTIKYSGLLAPETRKDKIYQAIIELRLHQEHMGCKITPLSELKVTQQELDEWLVSDPKRTAKMLHGELVKTINQEVKNATNAIRDRYRKKLDEYRGNNKGFKR